LLVGLTLLVPVLVLLALEGILRVGWPSGALPAFERLATARSALLVPSRAIGARYFVGDPRPPATPLDPFAARKAPRTLRIFVLGESSAAGFPYPHNGTFSRVLRDALRDVLPQDSVEVVNLGLAATNSFTMLDLVDDVIAQKPDAVLIYAGHNEYYGALGVGSTISAGTSPTLVRAMLAAQRWRTVRLLRVGLARAAGAFRSRPAVGDDVASLMESVAADQEIVLGSSRYEAGLTQFSGNLERIFARFRSAAVPVLVGSIASNLKDQPPLASAANGPARAAYDSARRALAQGDRGVARALFLRARDLDVVRFRAPSALNATIADRARRGGAVYVPVAERLDSAAVDGIPGSDLFLEHVHPNRRGYLLIAQSYFAALRDRGFLGRHAQLDRLAPWPDYERRMELSPFDERVAHHSVRAIVTRWPFVSRASAIDYRGSYQPADAGDSLALAVSRGGIAWAEAKRQFGGMLEARGDYAGALAEYRGIQRDLPYLELPHRFVGRTMMALGRSREAVDPLERALKLEPTAETSFLLGTLALQEKSYDRAIALLDDAVRRDPGAAAPLFNLSLAFGLSGNAQPARNAAQRLARLHPRHPGLAEWMRTLGMPPP
jgi:tetratricopeptide (TPR) repeat protein